MSDTPGMKLTLKVWRQSKAQEKGSMETYEVQDISPDISFLEMLDVLNEQLIKKGQEAIEFDNDCREGICGACSMVINGQPHGPELETATCQLHMRKFKDGDTIYIEPWRARALPVVKDIVVDRGALDRIIAAGGYVSTKSGPHADANTLLIARNDAEAAMDVAACIGCGACVAACPNASASLFVSAKITQFSLLPQGKVEATSRALEMVRQMDQEGFGNCTNIGECAAACPKGISIQSIATMKREYLKAVVR